MASTQLWSEIQATFKKDLPATVALYKLLTQERSALENRDYDALKDVTKNKMLLINALKNNANTRMHALQTAGFKDEKTTLEAAEQQAPIVAKSWRQLAKQWAECQHLNTVNEHIVQRTRLVVNQTLDLLRGANNQNRLYNTKGMTDSGGTGRTISNA